MRTRYYRDNQGNPTIKALVYDRADHNISRTDIDQDARSICLRLNAAGHETYIVGGAVRDLLLERTPKDFDIATAAPPSRVRRIFRNSRIIGRRFRLVHVYFRDGKIHEVATFRAPDSGDRNHVYGSLNEDVMRRDFSLNALYYDPEEETVIDFVGGIKDIRKKVLRSVLPLNSTFTEDPVRMLRAVKYAAITGTRIAGPVGRQIRKQASLLATASISRLSEELHKILRSRNAEIILRLLDRYKLLSAALPNIDTHLRNSPPGFQEDFFLDLGKLDQQMSVEEVSRGVMIHHLIGRVLISKGCLEPFEGMNPQFPDVVHQAKLLLRPLVQPNRDVEEAVRLIFMEQGYKSPRKRPQHPEVRAGETEREKAGFRRNRPRRRRAKSAEKHRNER